MINRLQETTQPVAVQETTFSVDVMGCFICNTSRGGDPVDGREPKRFGHQHRWLVSSASRTITSVRKCSSKTFESNRFNVAAL
jgi:hypothetical protein